MPAVTELNMFEVCRTGEFISRILFSRLSARFGSFLFAINPERWLIPKNRPYTGRADVPYLILLQVGFALLLAIADSHGGLLHRHFTLTGENRRFVFCGTIHQRGLPAPFPALRQDTLPFGVRTFLQQPREARFASDPSSTGPTLKKRNTISIRFVHKNRKLQSSFLKDHRLAKHFSLLVAV